MAARASESMEGKEDVLMDYVKEAENYLRHYASLKKSVEHAQYMIERLTYKSRPREVGAAQNDVTGVAAQCPGNTLQEMYELQRWQSVREESLHEIGHIERLLEGMDEKERRVLQMWYVEKMNAADVAADFGYDERRSVYNLKGKALKNFSVILFGVSALKAI